MLDWDEYVESIIEKGHDLFDKQKSIEAFRQWMQPRIILGRMWDYRTWIYLYYVWHKIHNGKDQVTIICGEEGRGKSKVGIMMNWTLNLEKFTLNHFIYSHQDTYKKFAESKDGDCFQVDEAENLVYLKQHASGEQIDFILTSQKCRTLHLHICLCLPDYWDVNPSIKFRRASAIIYVYYNNDSTGQLSFELINTVVNNRKALHVLKKNKDLKPPLRRLKFGLSESWMGNCYEKWIWFSYDDYESLFKKKGVRDEMLRLHNKYKNSDGSDVNKYISITEARKLSGLSDYYIRRLIRNNVLKGHQLNSKYFILRENFEKYLEKQGLQAFQETKYSITGEEQQKTEPKTKKNPHVKEIPETEQVKP